MIVLLLMLLVQNPEEHVKCTSIGGPFPLGTTSVTIPLKCCPKGMYVATPDHPTLDKKGDLICVEET